MLVLIIFLLLQVTFIKTKINFKSSLNNEANIFGNICIYYIYKFEYLLYLRI